MRRLWKRVLIILMVAGMFRVGGLLADRAQLRDRLIRLHVVANSDLPEDQSVKLEIRDAVLESIKEDLDQCMSQQEARAYLEKTLPKIESVANQVLCKYGTDLTATATLCKETFGIRHYDTFTLPSGIYESLRIVIGNGEGRNWWCVVFPSFCLPAASDDFEAVAAGAGFSDSLIHTLEGNSEYQIRFLLLDLLGRVENIFMEGDI